MPSPGNVSSVASSRDGKEGKHLAPRIASNGSVESIGSVASAKPPDAQIVGNTASTLPSTKVRTLDTFNQLNMNMNASHHLGGGTSLNHRNVTAAQRQQIVKQQQDDEQQH